VANRIKEVSAELIEVEISLMLELEYFTKLNELRLSRGGAFYSHKATHFVLRNGELIGDFMALISIAVEEFLIADAEVANTIAFENRAKDNITAAVSNKGHRAVYLEFFEDVETVGFDEPYCYGKVYIELFEDICPLACKNFVTLCSGTAKSKDNVPLSYLDSRIHRIVPGGWIQLGDIIDGSGTNSVAAVENGKFRDESFSVDFGASMGGIVGYASNEAHSNGSQFFITLGPCAWMNNQSVGFGRIIQGFPVLNALGASKLKNERPIPGIKIGAAGLLNR